MKDTPDQAKTLRTALPVLRLRRWFICAVVIVALALGAIIALTPLRSLGRSTSHFLPHRLDSRVHFEPGAEALAALAVAALPEAIAAVERGHYRPFVNPVVVYICASPESFASYGGSKNAGGFVLDGRLFVSSKPQNTAERMPRLLTHELSHLHLEEKLGMIACASHIPSWFKEGLAVLVASGGGAETVSVAEARAAIAANKTFAPAMSGRLVFERSGRSYGLSQHMWYRQSGLFVQFLRERDEAAFRHLLLLLDGGARFRSALEDSYPEGIEVLLKAFRADAVRSVGENEKPDKR